MCVVKEVGRTPAVVVKIDIDWAVWGPLLGMGLEKYCINRAVSKLMKVTWRHLFEFDLSMASKSPSEEIRQRRP